MPTSHVLFRMSPKSTLPLHGGQEDPARGGRCVWQRQVVVAAGQRFEYMDYLCTTGR